MSYYCHSTPGRLRIKTPIIKQNPVETEKVYELLHSLRGVDAVSVNALTGSITINYSDCETNSGAILSALEKNGYYSASQAEEGEHPIETAMSKVGTTLGRVILGAAVEKALEGSILSFLGLLI